MVHVPLRAWTLLAGVPAVVLAAACGRTGPADDLDYVVERTARGDTTVVHVRSGSVWRGPPTLIEEVRIGMLDGPDEYMFGSVQAMAPDLVGGVYVFDGQVPVLRHYAADGSYIRALGGRGGGPGEYQDAALGLAVRRDGSVLLRDPRNARINIYSREGEPLEHWPVASGLFTSRAMVLDTAEHVYLRILLERPVRNEPWRIGLLHLDAKGAIVDTIPDPRIDGEPAGPGGLFLPAKVWDWSPLGYPVVGLTSPYVFELRHADGRVTRVTKEYEPVSVAAEERAAYEARNAWMRENQGQFLTSEIPPVPGVKPAYSSLVVGEGGRVWVQKHVASEKLSPEEVPPVRPDQPPPVAWRAPVVYDVFEPDGTYLGEVSVPRRTTLWVFGKERIWGISRGDMDEAYVVAFRLQVAGN